MRLQFIQSALLACGLGVANANPHFRVSARDLFVAETCDDFVYGATSIKVGQVCASISNGNLIINYKALSPDGTYSDLHAWVGTTIPDGTTPGTSFGNWPYTLGNGICKLSADNTTGACTIPLDNSWRACSGKLYIATHASISGSFGGQTGFGAGPCFGKNQGNCPKYWSIDRACYCASTSFPAPVTQTSTSTTTYTSTSTTSFLTSTTSVYTITTSTTIEYSTTQYSTTTVTSYDTITSTSTPAPVTTTVSCLNPY